MVETQKFKSKRWKDAGLILGVWAGVALPMNFLFFFLGRWPGFIGFIEDFVFWTWIPAGLLSGLSFLTGYLIENWSPLVFKRLIAASMSILVLGSGWFAYNRFVWWPRYLFRTWVCDPIPASVKNLKARGFSGRFEDDWEVVFDIDAVD